MIPSGFSESTASWCHLPALTCASTAELTAFKAASIPAKSGRPVSTGSVGAGGNVPPALAALPFPIGAAFGFAAPGVGTGAPALPEPAATGGTVLGEPTGSGPAIDSLLFNSRGFRRLL